MLLSRATSLRSSRQPLRRRFAKLLSPLLIACSTVSCDRSPHTKVQDEAKGGDTTSALSIEGKVRDLQGPILEGLVEAEDSTGRRVARQTLDGQTGSYAIAIPSGTRYPVLLSVTPPVASQRAIVKAVVIHPKSGKVDIDDVTTLIIEAAQALGGLTETNLARVTTPSASLDPTPEAITAPPDSIGQ
jgi:hypothetical protein